MATSVRQPEASPANAPFEVADPISGMTPRFNFVFRWFARRFFKHLDLPPETVATVRELESRGTVIFVMRYASRLDYFLFNSLFLRDGLRLSGFANGVHFYYYRPLWQALRIGLGRLRARLTRRGAESHEERLLRVHENVLGGGSLFLFLRTARLRFAGRRQAVRRGKSELDFVEETVRAVWNAERPVFLVPLSLFWRKGPRTDHRFLNLAYGSPNRPSDVAKVASFLTTYRDLYVKSGEPIDLGAFIAQRRGEGQTTLARKVRRSLLVFFYREEKGVVGPTLRPRWKVQEMVLEGAEVQAVVEERARERGVDPDAVRIEAEKVFREIAANMNSTFLAILNVLVSGIFRRMFASIETRGLERVAEYAKTQPLVLVPSHRSYFDFLLLSWLFYSNHLVPPHIAARENMAFGPFGFIFRRAGAFFLRRSFDDPLYKAVFRRYVGYLAREGLTQEFFIEGGRSRTGKSLPPRLGMLGWNVEAFLASSRRDLFFVPIAISYERLVEEGAMVGELAGQGKKNESVLGLVRARKFLQRRFGSVCVSFGEPLSLAGALGRRRERLAGAESPEVVGELRSFVEALANRIVERINWASVVNSTSVAACALLGESRRGLFRAQLTRRMQQIVDLLRLQDVPLSPAIQRDEGEFSEAIGFLLRSDLIRTVKDERGEILYFDESRRRALDLYRNAIVHYLAAPSFLARRLLSGASAAELREDLAGWLDLFYLEFFVPRAETLEDRLEIFLDHFERAGWIERGEWRVRGTEKGAKDLRFLAAQTRSWLEAYFATCQAVLASRGEGAAKELAGRAKEQFERAELLGEVQRPEAANPVTFDNALDLLVRRGVLVRPPAEGSSRDRAYRPGPEFDSLLALRDRLATALAAG